GIYVLPRNSPTVLTSVLTIIILIVWFTCLCMFVTLGGRRLHDSNRSAAWLWLSLAPGLGKALIGRETGGWEEFVVGIPALWLLLLLVAPGTVGPNRFGADPREPQPLDGGREAEGHVTVASRQFDNDAVPIQATKDTPAMIQTGAVGEV